MSEQKSMMVLVVGGGLFGLTAALELRRRGHRVRVFENGPIPNPRGASVDMSRLIRMDYGGDSVFTGLMERAIEGWRAWNTKWRKHVYHETGLVVMARVPMRPGGFERDSFDFLTKRGHALERLNRESLQKRFPAWDPAHYPDGYFNPQGGWAEAGNVIARLADDARKEGVQIHEGTPYYRLLEKDGRVVGIKTIDRKLHAADLVILAAGAWTPKFLPELQPLFKTTGHPIIYFRAKHEKSFKPPKFVCWMADIGRAGWYGFPALPDGTIKIANHGLGIEMSPDDPPTVPRSEVIAAREFLARTFPSLADEPIAKERLCVYTDSWDGNFYIDHIPGKEGAMIATGGSGHAFKFAPVLGGLIADVAERKPNRFAQRFAWREKKEAGFSDPARAYDP